MKKNLLDEMIDELNKLRDEQKKISIPVPAKPNEVFKVIGRVAKEHEVTAEDLMVVMAFRSASPASDVSVAEMQTFEELKNQK